MFVCTQCSSCLAGERKVSGMPFHLLNCPHPASSLTHSMSHPIPPNCPLALFYSLRRYSSQAAQKKLVINIQCLGLLENLE